MYVNIAHLREEPKSLPSLSPCTVHHLHMCTSPIVLFAGKQSDPFFIISPSFLLTF